MRAHSLRTWFVVPLLLALPAVMALVNAAEAEAGTPTDCSAQRKPLLNTRSILGDEAYAAAINLDLNDPKGASHGHESMPPRATRSPAASPKRKTRTSAKTTITTPHTTVNTGVHITATTTVLHTTTRVHSHSPSPIAATTTGDPLIVLPLPELSSSAPSHTSGSTATGTARTTVATTVLISVSASHSLPQSSGSVVTHSSFESASPTASSTNALPSSDLGAPITIPTGIPGSVTVTTLPSMSFSTPTGAPSSSVSGDLTTATGTNSEPTRTHTPSVSGHLTTTTGTNSRPTGTPSRITSAPPRTTASTIATTTATTTKAPRTRTHKPKPTKTPWLPSTIVPVRPPKTTAVPSPGTSLPDVVIPNLHPKFPKDSFSVQLRFTQVSYYQVINDGTLAAQLVSFIPAQLAPLLEVSLERILVVAIRDGSYGRSSRRVKKRALVTTNDEDDAIRVTVAIPTSKYWALDALVSNKSSALYTPSGDGFGQYLDSKYPLSNRPPPNPSSGSKGNGGNRDPLTGDELGSGDLDRSTNGSSSSHGAIIGSLVGLATVAYVGIALVVVRMVRRKRLREQEAQMAAAPKISAPIRVQGGSQGWGWQGN
ncbi:hypothetical protein BGX28_004525 [Mortierella sp. GBA30]|nr:hypothetical protein BGX28_004525 [Mortierella sp. GBA30]